VNGQEVVTEIVPEPPPDGILIVVGDGAYEQDVAGWIIEAIAFPTVMFATLWEPLAFGAAVAVRTADPLHDAWEKVSHALSLDAVQAQPV